MTDEEFRFLIEDFEHWAESYFRNEEAGERRVSGFTAIVTAVLGGLAFLAKDGDRVALERVERIAPAALVALLVLGALTLMRIVRRNAATDAYLHALGTIRRRLVPAALVASYTARLPRERSSLSGGLATFVAAINAGLGAGAVWVAYGSLTSATAALLGLALFQTAIAIPWLGRRAVPAVVEAADAPASGSAPPRA